MTHRGSIRTLVGVCTVLLLTLAPAAMAEREIGGVKAGYDLWETLGSGATAYSFGKDPLPAGFFCEGSEPFSGRITFEGKAIPTEPQGTLGTTDTVVRRLDDAVFDKNGEGRTRIQIQALSLVGSKAVETKCGNWRVEVGLDKTQPVTQMTYHKEYSYGGYFEADLWVNARLTFVNERSGEERVATRLLNLPSANRASFACGATAIAACPRPVGDLVLRPFIVGDSVSKLSVSLTPGNVGLQPIGEPYIAEDCAKSCGCNEETGQCLPIYSWHVFCPHGNPPPGTPEYDECESHFTLQPCEHEYYSQVLPECQDDRISTEGYRQQLEELKALGMLDEDPEEVLRKQRRDGKR